MSPLEREKRNAEFQAAVLIDSATQEDGVAAGMPPSPPSKPKGLQIEFSGPTPTEVFLAVPKKRAWRRRFWPLEKTWLECVFCPFRHIQWVAGLGVGFAALTGVAVYVALPDVLDLEQQAAALEWSWILLVATLLFGFACTFLQSVLSSALGGEAAGPLRLRAIIFWPICFLAGPVAPAVTAFLFWFEGGDPAPVDYVILGELVLVALAHFLYTLLAVSRSGRLLDANPLRVLGLAHRLGVRVLAVVTLAAALGVLHVFLAVHTLEFGPREPMGWLLHTGCWMSAFFFATFFLRWLGLSCYWRTVRQ
jgi:hypothetical protein